MTDIATTITRMQRDYAAAVLEQSVERFASLYDPAVRVFDAWGVWEYEGLEAWRRAFHGWLTSLGDEKITVTFADTTTHGSPAMIITSSIVTYASSSAPGEAAKSMQNRLTWGVRAEGSNARIVHEHTSVPVGFEDMKAILQR